MNSQKILREGRSATEKVCPMMFQLSSRDHIEAGLAPMCVGDKCAWYIEAHVFGMLFPRCAIARTGEHD